MPKLPILTLSPSGAKQWLNCTASPAHLVRVHERLPKSTDTVFNIEGDQAHAIANALMMGAPLPTESRGKPIPKASIPEMVRHAEGFIAFCHDGEPVEWFSELKVPLYYMPARNGYIDFVGIWPEKVRIVDLKYGKGVAVDAEGNEQMLIYARSYVEAELLNSPFWLVTDATVFELCIYQPRVREGDPASAWTLTWAELKEHTDAIGHTAKRIIAGADDLVFAPSNSTCQWCPDKKRCEARNGKPVKAVSKAMVLVDPETPSNMLSVVSKDGLTEEQCLLLLTHKKEIESLLDAIHKDEYGKALAGHVPPGFKLVAGRGARVWSDKDTALAEISAVLGEDVAAPRELISPRQAELALKAAEVPKGRVTEILELADKIPGKASLVPEGDPRPALVESAANLFDVIDIEALPVAVDQEG